MINVRLAGDGKTRSLNPTHAKLHSILRHDFDGLIVQVGNEP
jgi:hypothetical protein